MYNNLDQVFLFILLFVPPLPLFPVNCTGKFLQSCHLVSKFHYRGSEGCSRDSIVVVGLPHWSSKWRYFLGLVPYCMLQQVLQHNVILDYGKKRRRAIYFIHHRWNRSVRNGFVVRGVNKNWVSKLRSFW